MYQVKVFLGTSTGGYENTAEAKCNKWLAEHPDIYVDEFKYQQARYGDHSIAIMFSTEVPVVNR